MLNAKSLVVLMVFPFALLLPLFLRASRRPFAVNVVLSLHLNAFLLLLFCAALGVVAVDRRLGGAGLEARWMDNTPCRQRDADTPSGSKIPPRTIVKGTPLTPA